MKVTLSLLNDRGTQLDYLNKITNTFNKTKLLSYVQRSLITRNQTNFRITAINTAFTTI